MGQEEERPAMNVFRRISGVFFNPKPVFESVAEKPVWVDVLVILLIALAAFSILVSPYARHDQLVMWKESATLKEKVGEARYNAQVQALENPMTTGMVLQTVVGGPLFIFVAMLIQAGFLVLLGRFVSTQGRFAQVFAALVHASSINLLLGNAVRLGLTIMRKSAFQTSTSLAMFFPKLPVMSKAYIFLSQIDFFQLWMFGVLAFGLAAAMKIKMKQALVLSYVVWFLKALVVNAGIGLWGASFLR